MVARWFSAVGATILVDGQCPGTMRSRAAGVGGGCRRARIRTRVRRIFTAVNAGRCPSSATEDFARNAREGFCLDVTPGKEHGCGVMRFTGGLITQSRAAIFRLAPREPIEMLIESATLELPDTKTIRLRCRTDMIHNF